MLAEFLARAPWPETDPEKEPLEIVSVLPEAMVRLPPPETLEMLESSAKFAVPLPERFAICEAPVKLDVPLPKRFQLVEVEPKLAVPWFSR